MAPQQASIQKDYAPVAQLFSELDGIIQTAAKGRMAGFVPISLRLPSTEPPIHAFYTAVSWLYVLVIESGPVHFRFLSERASALGFDPSGELQLFCTDIQWFRTVLQHNLDLSNANDLAKLVRCESWMARILNVPIPLGERFWPSNDAQWNRLAVALNERARRFGEVNLTVARRVLNDDFVEDVLREWIFRQTRVLSAYEYDTIAAEAADALGLNHIDLIRMRKVSIDEWNRRIRLVAYDSDVKRVARQCIERSLMELEQNYLPITGADIIEQMEVPPGPKVRKILSCARELYRKSPCGREELLNILKSDYNA